MRMITLAVVSLSTAACLGGPEVPRSPAPQQLYATYDRPREEVFRAAVAAVEDIGGAVVSQDPRAGLLVFTAAGAEVAVDRYSNVLLDAAGASRTRVYLRSWNATWETAERVRIGGVAQSRSPVSEREFFDVLDRRVREPSGDDTTRDHGGVR